MNNDGDTTPDPVEEGEDFPVADLRTRGTYWKKAFGGTRMWIATIACGIIALVLIGLVISSGGRTITISFEDGFGIKPGDTLRYRHRCGGSQTGIG